MKPYRAVDARWAPLGRTPLEEQAVPFAHLRIRIENPGFEPLEVATDFSGALRVRRFTLDPVAQAPAGMVHVPEGPSAYPGMPAVRTADFWLDRYEVTRPWSISPRAKRPACARAPTCGSSIRTSAISSLPSPPNYRSSTTRLRRG
jgi:hypothetical protein